MSVNYYRCIAVNCVYQLAIEESLLCCITFSFVKNEWQNKAKALIFVQ